MKTVVAMYNPHTKEAIIIDSDGNLLTTLQGCDSCTSNGNCISFVRDGMMEVWKFDEYGTASSVSSISM